MRGDLCYTVPMRIYELLLIAVGLSMDAFAVSITKGLPARRVRVREAAAVGAWFGAFQALMPLIGYFLGSRFREQIEAVDHWVAFGILAVIGGNMIREGLAERREAGRAAAAETEAQPSAQADGPERDSEDGRQKAGRVDLHVRSMFILAVATSIDALAVGISLALLHVHILYAALFIGCTTFLISFGGVYVGRTFGTRFKNSATLLGGAILIFIGIRILLEHLGILP